MGEQPERNKAGQALFQIQFGLLMQNLGRIETANDAFAKAQCLLMELEKELDE